MDAEFNRPVSVGGGAGDLLGSPRGFGNRPLVDAATDQRFAGMLCELGGVGEVG